MNFKKFLIGVAAAIVLIALYQFFTRVDRSNPVAVATAFTKAMKGKDFDAASKFMVPDQASAWRSSAEEKVSGMKSGSKASYYENIPEAPAFSAPVTAAGVTTIASADKNYTLEIKQIDGKWYVAKPPF